MNDMSDALAYALTGSRGRRAAYDKVMAQRREEFEELIRPYGFARLDCVAIIEPQSQAEQEERRSKGISSPTGWPIKRLAHRNDDGITIPPKPLKPSRVVEQKRLGLLATIIGRTAE